MKILNIEKISQNEINFYNISAMMQFWTDRKFSYKHIPRQQNGLFYCHNGSIEFKTESGVLSITDGDIVYLPKNSKYTVFFDNAVNPVISYLINFDISDTKDELIFSKEPRILLKNYNSFGNRFKKAAFSFSSVNKNSFNIQADFYRLFSEIIQKISTTTDNKIPEIIKKAIPLLEDYRNLTIAQIAEKCKSSESNLRVKFKDYMGISPNEYRTKSRIDKAKNLLATSQMSVKEITYLLGFYDESYFYKVFKTETGLTPKEYRNND